MNKKKNDRFYLQSKEYEGLLYDVVNERDVMKGMISKLLDEFADEVFNESGPEGKETIELKNRKKLMFEAKKLIP